MHAISLNNKTKRLTFKKEFSIDRFSRHTIPLLTCLLGNWGGFLRQTVKI